MICSCLGYRTLEIAARGEESQVEICLDGNEVTLSEAVVIATNPGVTETGARQLENKAMHVMNVMSAKAMELSPDITVASVIQRMSGVTVERKSSGAGQSTIRRGMDKR